MISADLLELLRCPQSGQPLALADPEILAQLNERISQGIKTGEMVRSQAGVAIGHPLAEALVRLDRVLLYPVQAGIPVLLVEDAIPL